MEGTESGGRREVQMFLRGDRYRATVSKCSALGMEIKRKKIRESALFPAQDDNCFKEKLDFEVRMREGICKLLSVSTQKEQIMNAVKNLMICNARIQVYMKQLNSPQEEIRMVNTGRRSSDVGVKERLACPGKLAISGIRIPLMWKDTDHFSSKEKSQRYAVFCMLKLDQEVFDTNLVFVDKTMTDICFENVIVFTEARPDFQLKLDLYSCCMEDSSITNTPKKLARKLRNSIGKSAGKKFNSEAEESEPEAFVYSNPHMPGAKYNLLAHITFTLESVEDNCRTHTLTVTGHEECSFWLPLYGSVCCRLVAQPACLTDEVMVGFLNQQEMVGGIRSCIRMYCVLKGGYLHCYYSPEEIEAKIEPTMTIPVNKETRIRAVDKDSKKTTNSFRILNLASGEAVTKIFSADSREDLQKWMEAFWQHFYNLSQWKHCSEELMKMETLSPQKPPLFLTKEATSVYHDMSIGSPMKFESLTDILHRKIEETDGQFLIGQEESAPPPWAALFDGNHQMHVEKSTVSPLLKQDGSDLVDGKGKKRRAPPPPPNKMPYLVGEQKISDPSEKENLWPRSSFSRKSLDVKLSSIMQQFQRPMTGSRKPVPSDKDLAINDHHQTNTEESGPSRPVPAPRQKSMKERLDPRSWLQSQE
ncbi:rhotekin-2 isoform X2 [Hyperolius riggenbachi]|uniref:rhotekin-2 isoform X2 n=1 Tax=Hyperolius riggenbachi TaxID=752182 RepID=UPI0035A28769